MQNQRIIMARKYLFRFDEILDEMADKMLSQNFINNITIDFIVCMIPHHQAAIYMCENLLKFTRYEPLQRICENIIQMQTKGIEQMEEIKNTIYGFNNIAKDVETYEEKYLSITKNMITKMKNSPRCININLNFVNEMIPHHEGAIQMCNNLLQYYIDPRLKMVADSIIREQSQGIEELKQVQKNLCYR